MKESRQISLRTYTIIDLCIFTFLICLFEFIGIKGLEIGIPKEYLEKGMVQELYISITLPLLLIVQMRWGYKMWFLPALAGIAYCLSLPDDKVTYQTYLTYGIGNMFIMFNLLWFIKYKEKISKNSSFTILYILTGFLLISIGRSFMGIFFGGNFFHVFVGSVLTEILNLIACLFIVLIARLQKGLFQDQIKYLLEVQKEESEKRHN